jgi:hypothetical protein
MKESDAPDCRPITRNCLQRNACYSRYRESPSGIASTCRNPARDPGKSNKRWGQEGRQVQQSYYKEKSEPPKRQQLFV